MKLKCIKRFDEGCLSIRMCAQTACKHRMANAFTINWIVHGFRMQTKLHRTVCLWIVFVACGEIKQYEIRFSKWQSILVSALNYRIASKSSERIQSRRLIAIWIIATSGRLLDSFSDNCKRNWLKVNFALSTPVLIYYWIRIHRYTKTHSSSSKSIKWVDKCIKYTE